MARVHQPWLRPRSDTTTLPFPTRNRRGNDVPRPPSRRPPPPAPSHWSPRGRPVRPASQDRGGRRRSALVNLGVLAVSPPVGRRKHLRTTSGRRFKPEEPAGLK